MRKEFRPRWHQVDDVGLTQMDLSRMTSKSGECEDWWESLTAGPF